MNPSPSLFAAWVLLGILCAGCTTIPLEEHGGVLGKGAGNDVLDTLPDPDVGLPPIEPVIPKSEW